MTKKSKVALVCIPFIIIQCWSLFLTFHHPLTGISVYTNSSNQIVVEEVDSRSAGKRLGIQPEDIILKVNGDDARYNSFVQRFGSVDQVKDIMILRNGERFEYQTHHLGKFYVYDIVYLFAEIISLVLAFMIYKKVKATPSSFYLTTILMTLAVIFMNMGSSVRGDPLGKYLISAGMLLMPIFLYQFIRAMMAEKAHVVISARLLKPTTGLVIAHLVVMLSFFVNSPYTYPIYLLSKISMLVIGLLGILFNALLLVYLYFKYRSQNEPAVMLIKSIALALVCAIAPLTCLSLIPELWFGHAWVNALYTSYFLFLLPISFVHLLITRRLYDINQLLRRIIMIALIALVPSLLQSAGAKLILIHHVSNEHVILFFLVLWASNSLLLYSLEYINTRMEFVVFPRNYHLKQVLKKIARNLGTTSTWSGLRETILTEIVDAVEISGAAIAFRHPDGFDIIYEGEIQEDHVKHTLASPHLDESNYMCLEISRQEQGANYLVVTTKKNGTILGIEDLNWLRLVISYLAVALENVHLIRKLDDKVQHLSSLLPTEEEADHLLWFHKLMLNYQEQERVRLALDLHDTTMQDLFFLKRNLQLATEKDTTELEAHIHKLSDFIDRINQNLRQSCFELHPHLLREIGLVGTLNKLFQVERKLNSFQIHYVTFGDNEIEQQDMELKRNVFRMVQELLNNAKKYASAANVRFSLSLEGGAMYLEYMDDGIGFDPAKPVVREISSNGMGIRQMKTRIAAMGGKCEIRSEAGKGVHFEAQFPVKDSHTGLKTP